MSTVINPEVIGVFGLMVTVIVFGLEQVGVGVKGGNLSEISKSLAYIAIIFGGVTQIFTSLCMYLFSVGGDHSLYLGTVFGFFGLFWVMVGVFFIKGGDKKVLAHFFGVSWFLILAFLIIAIQDAFPWYFITVLVLILGLLAVLIPAWYGKGAIWGRIAGVINILIGLFAIPIFLGAIGLM